MFGILLAAVGAFCEEVSSSVGKYAFAHKWEHPVTMGLLNNGWTVIYFFVISLLVPSGFVLVPASIPFLVILVVLGSAQTVGTLFALQRASRSTFGVLRTLTIPALAILDIIGGTFLSPTQWIAIALIYMGIVWLHRNHGIERKGAGLVLFTAMNGAFSIWLLKYVLDMGTSVPAAQLIILVPGLILLGAWEMGLKKQKHKKKKGIIKILTFQTATYGMATLVESYALLFAPASIMVTSLRSSSVLFAIISGNAVFHERHLKEKLLAGLIIIIGLTALAFG